MPVEQISDDDEDLFPEIGFVISKRVQATVKKAMERDTSREGKPNGEGNQDSQVGKTRNASSTSTEKSQSKDTKQASSKCQRCGRNTHTKEGCFAKTSIDGEPLLPSTGVTNAEKVASGKQKGEKRKSSACSRCGRKNHSSDTCFAKTHIDGDELSDLYFSDSGGNIYLNDRVDKARKKFNKKHKKDSRMFPEDGCYRCGRKTHDEDACFAYTDIFGNDLPGRKFRSYYYC